MTPHFGTVTVIGTGLLGGSLGLALKARGLAGTVRGVGHRQSSLDQARAVGAIDEAFLDARAACADADLVVVCTPAALVPAKLDEIRPVCAPNAAVTDVASTKGLICAHAHRTWPQPRRFVGSHPMAGSEKFGPDHADADLYAGAVVVVEHGDQLAPDVQDTVRGLWTAVGANVVEIDPARHDALVARSSHVPHVLAACLARLAAGQGDMRALVGTGLRDMTRVAAGRPELWRDICLTNADAILDALDALTEDLARVREAIANRAAEPLTDFFEAGRQARREVLGE